MYFTNSRVASGEGRMCVKDRLCHGHHESLGVFVAIHWMPVSVSGLHTMVFVRTNVGHVLQTLELSEAMHELGAIPLPA